MIIPISGPKSFRIKYPYSLSISKYRSTPNINTLYIMYEIPLVHGCTVPDILNP